MAEKPPARLSFEDLGGGLRNYFLRCEHGGVFLPVSADSRNLERYVLERLFEASDKRFPGHVCCEALKARYLPPSP